MNSEKLGLMEAIGLIVIVMVDKIILNTPKEIISTMGSSAWLNILYISIIAILIAWFIAFLYKKFPGKDILDICEFLGGKALKIVFGIMSIILILLVSSYVVKNFSETLHLIYFDTSPYIYISLFFIICSIIANSFSLKVIAKANLLLVPIALASIFIILISSIKSFMPQRIYPILGYGVENTFFKGLGNLFTFSGIFYLLLINPFIGKAKDFKKISLISILISAIIMSLSVICLLLSLAFTFDSNELFSLYVLTRNFEYGRFVQRIDALFILIWIMATISYLSITIYFCKHIFRKITNISNTNSINYSFNLFMLAILTIPTTVAIHVDIIAKYSKTGSIILVFFISLAILILANIKMRFFNKKKGQV